MSGGVVVEGSGGASMQNLVKSVLLNATATGRFSNAGLTFAPTDSDQVGLACEQSPWRLTFATLWRQDA